jgi:Carboxypeptidase regulatory-like domain
MNATSTCNDRACFRRVAVLLFILVIGSWNAFAQFEAVTLAKPVYIRELSGQVKDPTGGEIEGARVDLVDIQTQQVIASTTTNNKGDFHFDKFDKNSYKLKIFKPGFNILQVTVLIRKNAPALVDLKLPIAS